MMAYPKKPLFVFLALGLLLLGVIGLAAYFLWYAPQRAAPPWFAVHLINNEVAIGHVLSQTPYDITMRNVYFLQTLKKIDDRAGAIDPSAPPIYNLIPRTEHPTLKTDGSMVIDRRAVLFWEKLDAESEAVRALNKGK